MSRKAAVQTCSSRRPRCPTCSPASRRWGRAFDVPRQSGSVRWNSTEDASDYAGGVFLSPCWGLSRWRFATPRCARAQSRGRSRSASCLASQVRQLWWRVIGGHKNVSSENRCSSPAFGPRPASTAEQIEHARKLIGGELKTLAQVARPFRSMSRDALPRACTSTGC
jgi:hypothetical protein